MEGGSTSKRALFFRAFSRDHALCVVQCLRQYEKVTKDIRPTDRLETSPLFLILSPIAQLDLRELPIGSKISCGRQVWIQTPLKRIQYEGHQPQQFWLRVYPFRTFSIQLIGMLNPHFRDFITDLKRRMSMPAPY